MAEIDDGREREVNEKLMELLDNYEELKKVLQTLPGVDPEDPRFDPRNSKGGKGGGSNPE
jgi:hypothetical protein